MEKRHILIGGKRGAGKSTLIEKLLKSVDRPLYGYFTRSTPRREDGFHQIYLHRASDTERERSEKNHIGDCNGRERTVNQAVFETLGVEYLKHEPDGIIAMDEIGFMEVGCEPFCDAVRACLNGETHVLGAVKARFDIPFLDEIRAHPKALFFELTPDNRDELYETLLPLVLAWNEEERQG